MPNIAEAVPSDAYRQSLLTAFDACPRSARFSLEENVEWSSGPQARGVIFHRVAAEILRTLRREGESQMPTEEAMVILREQLAQDGVAPVNIVRVPRREQEMLRVDVLKFVTEFSWDTKLIVDVERRLYADVEYELGGEKVTRRLTGALDMLMADPPGGAIVVDHKTGWYLPPETPEDRPDKDADHLSYRGWAQQRMYAWLVMKNFAAINRVTYRELYPRFAATRQATLYRQDLEHVEYELTELARSLDRSMRSDDIDMWKPIPGKHCGYCPKPGACPLRGEERGEGALESEEAAQEYAGDMLVADATRKQRIAALKVYVDANGPLELRASKGRQVLGWKVGETGRRSFGVHVPQEEA